MLNLPKVMAPPLSKRFTKEAGRAPDFVFCSELDGGFPKFKLALQTNEYTTLVDALSSITLLRL